MAHYTKICSKINIIKTPIVINELLFPSIYFKYKLPNPANNIIIIPKI